MARNVRVVDRSETIRSARPRTFRYYGKQYQYRYVAERHTKTRSAAREAAHNIMSWNKYKVIVVMFRVRHGTGSKIQYVLYQRRLW